MKPLLGIGLDYKYRDRYHGGLVSFVGEWRRRLSHLSLVNIEHESDAKAVRAEFDDLPMIHHLSSVAPADPRGPDIGRMTHLDGISRALAAEWCGEDIGVWSVGRFALPYFVAPPLTRRIAEFTARGIVELQSKSSVPFLAELPYATFQAGDLTMADFFAVMVEASGCGTVLDISHVYAYSLANGKTFSEALHGFPMDSVVEIHIAGGRIENKPQPRYVDTHSHPILPEIIDGLVEVVPRCANLAAVTYEIGVALEQATLAEDFSRIESSLERLGFQPRIGSRA